MDYKSTSAIPQNRQRLAKALTITNASPFATDLWTPPSKKRVMINDTILAVINNQSNSYIIVGIEVLVAGSWELLIPAAAGGAAAITLPYNFGQRIRSAPANGGAVIRAVYWGTSSNWEARIVMTGEEV